MEVTLGARAGRYGRMSRRGAPSRRRVPRRRLMVTSLATVILLAGRRLGGRCRCVPTAGGQDLRRVGGRATVGPMSGRGRQSIRPSTEEFSAGANICPAIFKRRRAGSRRFAVDDGGASRRPRAAATMITPGAERARPGRRMVDRAESGRLRQRRLVVYVRLMAEMDGYWNFYDAFGPSGPRNARSLDRGIQTRLEARHADHARRLAGVISTLVSASSSDASDAHGSRPAAPQGGDGLGAADRPATPTLRVINSCATTGPRRTSRWVDWVATDVLQQVTLNCSRCGPHDRGPERRQRCRGADRCASPMTRAGSGSCSALSAGRPDAGLLPGARPRASSAGALGGSANRAASGHERHPRRSGRRRRAAAPASAPARQAAAARS